MQDGTFVTPSITASVEERSAFLRRVALWTLGGLAITAVAAVISMVMLPAQGIVDDAYYRAEIDVIDERLALGGLRLAALLNQQLTTAPPTR